MKILFVLGLEVNPNVGGIERVTYVLTRYFLNAGIKVYYFYFNLNELSFPEYHEKVEVLFPPDIANEYIKENVIFLNNLLVDKEINILINQGYTASGITKVISEAAINTNAKIITVLHSTPFRFPQFYGYYKHILTNYLTTQKNSLRNKLKSKILILLGYRDYLGTYKRFTKISFNSSARFVLLSRSYIPLFKKIFKVDNVNKLISLPNPISFNDDFSVKSIDEKKKQVIYVGRLEYHSKRLDRLINAWSLIENGAPGWKLILVGGTLGNITNESDYQVKELKRLKELVETLQLKNVIFAGNKNPEVYYKESKIFCLTSSFEGFPLVLGEAMHYGVVPVVFGSFEAAYDIVEHNVNGFVAKPYDITEYASLLSELMINDSKTHEMAMRAMVDSKKYSIEVIGDLWIKLFRHLVK